MTKKLKPIPRFKTEAEERRFWETHCTTNYVDWSKTVRGMRFPNLKFSTTEILFDIPSSLLEQIKLIANRYDLDYKDLIKIWVYDKAEEFHSKQRV